MALGSEYSKNAPFLAVGDIFQHETFYSEGYRELSCVYLVIRVVQRPLELVTDTSCRFHRINTVIFEFVCISLKTFKRSSEFQFLDDKKLPSYYRILSRNA